MRTRPNLIIPRLSARREWGCGTAGLPVGLQRTQKARGQLDLEQDAVHVVGPRQHPAALVALGDGRAVTVGNPQGNALHSRAKRPLDAVHEGVHPLPRAGGDGHAVEAVYEGAEGRARLEAVHLVEGDHRRPPPEFQLAEQ